MTSLGEGMLSQKKHFLDHEFAKVQIAGPLISANSFQTIQSFLANFKNHPIVFLDEPKISYPLGDFEKIIHELKKKFEVGVHSCNHFNPKDLFDIGIDYLSYDTELSHHDVLKSWDSNPKLVLGIIPTDKNYAIDVIYDKYKDFIFSHKEKLLLSPACGLAGVSPKKAWGILNDLKTLQQRFLTYTKH